MQSPAATEVETLLPPGPRRRHQQAFLEDYMQYSSSHQQSASQNRPPNHLGVRPNAGESHKDMKTRSHDHMNIFVMIEM